MTDTTSLLDLAERCEAEMILNARTALSAANEAPWIRIAADWATVAAALRARAERENG